jgi:hypothetical protein
LQEIRMKMLRCLALLTVVFGAAACSSPALPIHAQAGPRLDTAPMPSAQAEDQPGAVADSTAARGGGNLMGGN